MRWPQTIPSERWFVLRPRIEGSSSFLKILCDYGEEEAETLCKDLDLQRTTVIRVKGGQHLDGNYQAIAGTLLREVAGSTETQNKP